MATINDPKHMDPSEVVEARFNEPDTAWSLFVNHQLPTTPHVEQCATFCTTVNAQNKLKSKYVSNTNDPNAIVDATAP